MDKRRGKATGSRLARASVRGKTPPPSSRTRSKSPARVENSGRDSAPITRRGRPKKTDTPSEESSSQSSTPKKEVKKTKKTPVVIVDDSAEEEITEINTRPNRLLTLRKRLTPVNYKTTPTPTFGKPTDSRSASSLTKEDSQEESDEVEIVEPPAADLGIFSRPAFVGAIIVSLLIVPIILQIASRGTLSWTRIVAILGSGATYCNRQAGSFYVAFLTSTILLAFIPIGRVAKIPGSDAQVRCSGLLSAVVIVAFLVGLEFRGLDSLTAIYNNIDRFLYLSIFSNLVISIVLYIRSRKNATSGFICSFVNGIDINPKVLDRLDVKAISYNRSIILILIINIALLYKNVSIPVVTSSAGAPIGELIREAWNNLVFVIQHAEYHCSSLIVSSLLVLYALDALIFQHHLTASYQNNSEGCGAEILLRFATFPFLVSLAPRYLFIHKPEICCWVSGAAAVVFLIGLILKRRSSCLKYEYRNNPSDSRFKDMPTLPTLQNNRLIIGCWWAHVRHPTHVGEIICHVAILVALAASFNLPAFIGIIYIIAYLICRSIITNRKNAHKYESAWQRYTEAVKYNLLPRVY